KILSRHITNKEAGWKMLFVEKEHDIAITFTEDDYNPHDSLENKEAHTFTFKGIMDRVDFHEGNKQYMITDYKTNRKNDAEPLQLIVYEKMLKEKHGEANKVASQFDYILQEKTS